MPRDIPVGNGSLLVAFDSKYQIRDFYFPHPGLENHSAGEPFRFGIWVDGVFSWISSNDWSRKLSYEPETLVTRAELSCARFNIEIVSNDTVDFYENVLIRRLLIRNLASSPIKARIFFHHDFHISETNTYDTAYYDPSSLAIVHYERNRYFLIGSGPGFDQWATGTKELHGAEGTWRDAEDGDLQGNPIAQGSVDSAIRVPVDLEPKAEAAVSYWICAGTSYAEVRTIHDVVRDKSPEGMIERTRNYWRAWVNKEDRNLGPLPPKVADAYKRSLLIIRTNLDNNGAIIAANDSDVETFNGDTYSYMWPRDGALTAYALDLAGHAELTRRFYGFAKSLISPEGFYLHKYTPDGMRGSSWLPWYRAGEVQLPIQEDETALVIWGLWNHYDENRDFEFVGWFYHTVVTPAAEFMCSYRDSATGLPLPSWDLWEERRGVHTFTVATVWAGLRAAANFAELFGEHHLKDRYRGVADEIKQGLAERLYRPEVGRFARSLLSDASGQPSYDTTIDSSLGAVWFFGMLPPEDPMIAGTMKAIEERLTIKTNVGGICRYEGDAYNRVSNDVVNVPGNPWFICTLWLAQYKIARALKAGELDSAMNLIEWVVDHALPSGVLAEQVNPFNDEPLSVSPLTWSHAQLVIAVIEYLKKLASIGG